MKNIYSLFFLSALIIPWNVFSAQVGNQANNISTQALSEEITYSIEGKKRYIELRGKNNKYKTEAIISHIATSLLQELLLKNKLNQVNSDRYLSICERDIFIAEKQKEAIALLIPRFDAYAIGIVAMNKEKISAEDTFIRFIKVRDATISENEWLNASKKYSLDWADRFLKYDQKNKINSLVYSSYISLAYYATLKDKIIKEVGDVDKAKLSTILKKQLEDFSIELPDEYNGLKAKAIQKACDILIDFKYPKEIEQLIETIKKDYQL